MLFHSPITGLPCALSGNEEGTRITLSFSSEKSLNVTPEQAEWILNGLVYRNSIGPISQIFLENILSTMENSDGPSDPICPIFGP
jgi:hypothetical protein